jgi:hypothetical protein
VSVLKKVFHERNTAIAALSVKRDSLAVSVFLDSVTPTTVFASKATESVIQISALHAIAISNSRERKCLRVRISVKTSI